MTERAQIHVAHAIGHKGGTHYRARAYVLDTRGGFPVKHSFAISIDDSADEAERAAVAYVRDMFRRDGLQPPESVVSHGRLAGPLVDSFLFPAGAA